MAAAVAAGVTAAAVVVVVVMVPPRSRRWRAVEDLARSSADADAAVHLALDQSAPNVWRALDLAAELMRGLARIALTSPARWAGLWCR